MRIGRGPSPYFRHKYVLAKPPRRRGGWKILIVLVIIAGLGWYAWPYLTAQFSGAGEAGPPATTAGGGQVTEMQLPPPKPPGPLAPKPPLAGSNDDPLVGTPGPPAPETGNTAPPGEKPLSLPSSKVSAPEPSPKLPEAGQTLETERPSAPVGEQAARSGTEPTEDRPDTSALRERIEQQLAEGNFANAENTIYPDYNRLAGQAPQQAAEVLEKILVAHLEFARDQLDAGHVLSGEPNAAVAYQQMRRVAPEHQTVKVLAGEITNVLGERLQQRLEQNHLFKPEEDSAHAVYLRLREFAPERPETEEARQKLLSALLAKAETQLQARHYTTPEHDNAHDTYQLVLQLEPANTQATQGIKTIADSYAELAQRRLEQGRRSDARVLIERGLSISPRHPGLMEAQLALENPPAPEDQSETPPPGETREAPSEAPTNEATSVAELLEQARTQLEQDKLSQPTGDNAYQTYQAVLERDPRNEEARQGIWNIADRYEALARAMLERGDQESALFLTGEGLGVAPAHPGLLTLKRTILDEWRNQESGEGRGAGDGAR